MLRLKTSLELVNRFDAEVTGNVASGEAANQGTWGVLEDGELKLPAAGAAGALQIFTESNRDGTDG